MSSGQRWTAGLLIAIASLAIYSSRTAGGCLDGSAAAFAKVGSDVPPPPPGRLQVSGGEETWHADNSFHLGWENPSREGQSPIESVHYRVRDPESAVAISDTKIAWAATWIDNLHLPGIPGAYTVEVWLEDMGDNQGAPATAKLRFDNARPAQVQPLASSGWIGRNAIPFSLSLSHPPDPLPEAGIRGYALSVDGEPSGDPCAEGDRCTDAETDLRGGIGADRYLLAALPEGTSYVHAVAVSGSGMKSAAPGNAALHVDKTDPVTVLSGAAKGWANRPVALTATAIDALSGMAPDGAGGPFTAIRVDDGVPKTAAGSSMSAAVIGEGIHTIAYYARDAAGNVNDGGGSNGLPNGAPSTAEIRIDREEPDVSFVNSQRPDDPEQIEARVFDSLSGPDPSRGRIAIRRVGPGEQFEALPTEVSNGKLRAHWSSESYPAGEYEFRATAYDIAGNAASSLQRANGASMVLTNPLKAQTAVHAGFGGRVLVWHRCVRRNGRRRCQAEAVEGFEQRPPARFVPYGRQMLFSGQLIAGQSSPLARMPVQVIERFGAGVSPPERVTTVETGDDGVFSTRLAPGPSRQVEVVFQGTRTLNRSVAAPVRLGMRGGVRLRTSAPVATVGGRPIVFSGKVEGENIPLEGKSVELQFRLPHLPWTEFRTIQTDAHGHFHFAYGFTDDDSRGVRFEFRAFAPAQSGWPYEPAGSKAVAVRGR